MLFVAGNIGKLESVRLSKRFEEFFDCYDKGFGRDAGLLRMVDNPRRNHKALTSIADGSVYYLPVFEEQAQIWTGTASTLPLATEINHGRNARLHIYIIRHERDGSENRR